MWTVSLRVLSGMPETELTGPRISSLGGRTANGHYGDYDSSFATETNIEIAWAGMGCPTQVWLYGARTPDLDAALSAEKSGRYI